MLFNSFSFLILFLPLVLFVAKKLNGQPLLRWISLSSFVFYSFAGHVWFLIPMFVTAGLDFYLAPRMAAAKNISSKKYILMFSLVCNLGLLFYFKYSKFVFGVFDFSNDFFNVILPAGISFYTFQTMSYMIDIYRGHAEPEHNFWRFIGFISFFPHLVAGPITRHNQLIPQLTDIAENKIKSRWEDGIYLFSVGLCKKVLVADVLANLTHPLIGDAAHMTFITSWLALLGFTVQIYFDFSGYTDMAIGLGRLFGIELPKNFNSPYQATNPSDFWCRWHISLSQWLRDYLYISLGGNRCSPFSKNLNLMLTMVLGGFWHGASWTFAMWGTYHGLILIIFHKIEKSWIRLPLFLQKGVTFILVTFSWLLFRAPSWHEATAWASKLFYFSDLTRPLTFILTFDHIRLLFIVAAGIFISMNFKNASSIKNMAVLTNYQKFGLGILTLAAIMMINYSSKFLYFQF